MMLADSNMASVPCGHLSFESTRPGMVSYYCPIVLRKGDRRLADTMLRFSHRAEERPEAGKFYMPD